MSMTMTGGRPLAQAYTSVAESKRWMNRFPIANESSDQDVGGGVSLAVSDLDDTPDASHHSHTSGENDEETPTPPTRVPSNLKGDAKPFVPIVGPASVETTPTSVESAVMRTVDIRSVSSMMAVSQPDSIKKSASVHTSATQIATIEPVQPVDPQPKTITAEYLMNLYMARRIRSTTLTTQEKQDKGTTDNAVGHRGYESSSACSATINAVAQGEAARTAHAARSTVVTKIHVDNTKQHHNTIQQQNNSSGPSDNANSSALVLTHGVPQHTTDTTAHAQNTQVIRQKPSTVNYRDILLPIMLAQAAQVGGDNSGSNSHAIEGQHLNGRMPSTNTTPGAMNKTQVPHTLPGPAYQQPQTQVLLNGSGTAANILPTSPSSSVGVHSQLQDPFMSDNKAHGGNMMPVTPTRVGTNFQQHQHSQVVADSQTGSSHNHQVTPTYAVNPQYSQAQRVTNGMNGLPLHQQARGTCNQPVISPYTAHYQQSQVQGHNNGGGSFAKNQNGSPAHVLGYNNGLPKSASDGTMQHCPRYMQTNANSTAVIQLDRRNPVIIHDQPAVVIGPMDFEVPSKEVMCNRSEVLQALTENGRPHSQDLFDPTFLPFVECFKYSFPVEENGVIVMRNIPYETTRGEVVALMGRTSKMLNDTQEPVHIIMDRVTSKTEDAYVEVTNLNAAIELVDRFKRNAEYSRIARLGNRVVEVELSSQTQLMQALFPSTKDGVNWIGARPTIVAGSQWPWENFKSFFTEEEMAMLSKHVDSPQRTSFARVCPERPYECMISTLRKIPWYMAEYITIKQRHSVYEACLKMIQTLATKVRRTSTVANPETERLTPELLHRLVTSAMLCPGFSVVQKHNIASVAGISEDKARQFNQPRFADSWRYQWTLAPKSGMPIDVLEWYIAVIRAETNRVVQNLDISQRMSLQGMMQGLDGYWGFYWAEANFPVGKVWDDMSLAECSRLEWQAIERIITRAIQGGNVPPSYTTASFHVMHKPNGQARLNYQISY